MRASLFALALLATSACTQGNVQLPPAYDGGSSTTVDSSVGDATEDGAEEASVEAAAGDASDAAREDGGDAAVSSEAGGEAGSEGGPSDAGDGGG
jgi:hypothetical protein